MTVAQLFYHQRAIAGKAKDAISELKPIPWTSDRLLAEIQKGDERAEKLVSLILYVQDLTNALYDTVDTATTVITDLQRALQAIEAQNGDE